MDRLYLLQKALHGLSESAGWEGEGLVECSSEVKANFHYFILLKRVQSRSSCLQGVLFFSSFPFISISSCISGAASPALAHCLERRVLYSAVLCCRGKWTRQTTCSFIFLGIFAVPKISAGLWKCHFCPHLQCQTSGLPTWCNSLS